MKAWDLTEEQRQQILDSSREQLGEERYQQMLNQYGEYGLVDLILETMDNHIEQQKRVKVTTEKVQNVIGWVQGVIFILLIIASFFLVRLGDDSEEMKFAVQQVARMVTTGTENEQFWGLRNFTVFGSPPFLRANSPTQKVLDRGCYTAPFLGIPIKRCPPVRTQVDVPIWIRGTTPAGETGRWKQTLSFMVERPLGEQNHRITMTTLSERQPLSFPIQVLTWLFWSLVGPTALMIVAWGYMQNYCSLRTMQIIFSILAVPLAGYLAYIFFADKGMIWIFVLVYIGIGYLYLRLLIWLLKAVFGIR
jgi:hypothetical protein